DHWTLENTIERLNLHPLLDEGVIKLSNGETRKVLIAAALLRNPVLLLLQYPFAGLDEASRTMLSVLIDQVSQYVTIVLATRPNEIPASVQQVVVVNQSEPLHTVPKSEF